MEASGSSHKAETLTETAATVVAGENGVDAAASAKTAKEPVQLDGEATETMVGEKVADKKTGAADKGETAAADKVETGAAAANSSSKPAGKKAGKKGKASASLDNEAAAEGGTKETESVTAATSEDKTAELTSSKVSTVQAPAPTSSMPRTSSSGLPPAPAGSGAKGTSSSGTGKGAAKATAALSPSKQRAAVEPTDTAVSKPVEPLDESTQTVKALREQLSQNGTLALTGGTAQPVAPAPRGDGQPQRRISEHDRTNNTNALELLQSGTFKLVPGKDTVPYDKLITLRLEDGIDVTRKEEYLSPEEYTKILGMDKAAFQKLPAWKRLQIKKSKLLF